MKEIWEEINGTKNHWEISNKGRIRSIRNGKKIIHKQGNLALRSQKYRGCTMAMNDGSTKSASIHRLVAENFVPKPSDKDYVNHIDGDKLNNTADNLEWVTASENIMHSYHVLGNVGGLKRRPVFAKELNKTFKSINEAARCLGLKASHIQEVCAGKLNKTGGIHWSYAEEA